MEIDASRLQQSGRQDDPLEDSGGRSSTPFSSADVQRLGAFTGCGEQARELYRRIFRPQSDPRIDFTVVLLAVLVYGVLYFMIGSDFLPGNAAWCTILIWASGMVGAYIAHLIYLPRVIGMMCAGLLLENIPWSALDAFPKKWGSQMRAGALATIFLRCGLELDFGTMRRFKQPAIRMALIPGLVEAFYDGGLGVALFNMPVMLAFSMGFILKAVGPGLVVPAMFKLQKTGLGKDQGIPSTIVIAASFDDIVAITGFSIFSSIAINSGTGHSVDPWKIAQGPVQVVIGIAGGLLIGSILGFTRLFDSRVKRFIATYGSCLFIMFLLNHWDLLSGGALGSLAIGLVASNAWERGFPRFASLGSNYDYSPQLERWRNIVWMWIAEPLLFTTIGTSLNFSSLASGTIGNAVCIVCTGLCLRVLASFFVMMGMGYTWKERLFYAVAWTPKATVQAALSATPALLIAQAHPGNAEWQQWGQDILTTGIFCILICATIGTIAIHFTAPLLLRPSAKRREDHEAEEHEREPALEEGEGGEAKPLPPPAPQQRLGGSTGAASEPAPRRPPSGLLQGAAIEDYELLAEYIDTITQLAAVVQCDVPHEDRDIRREEARSLARQVLDIQRRIEHEVGRREPSVREMFRTAAVVASRRASRAGGFFGGGAAVRPVGGLTGPHLQRSRSATETRPTRASLEVDCASEAGRSEPAPMRPGSPDSMA